MPETYACYVSVADKEGDDCINADIVQSRVALLREHAGHTIDVIDVDGAEMIIRATQDAVIALGVYMHGCEWGEIYCIEDVIDPNAVTVAAYVAKISGSKS